MEARVSEQFEAIAHVFAKAQKSQATHAGCRDALERLVRTSSTKIFAEDFLTLLRPALAVDKAANANAIDRLVAFAVTFAVQTSASVPSATQKGVAEPFALWLLHRVLLWHDVRGKAVRYRVTQLLALLLKHLPEETNVPEKIWNALEQALLRRAHDRVAPVRVEAVRALSRLQNPNEEGDKVVALFFRLLQQDPIPDVRRAVVCEIALARHTLQPLLARLRDRDANVRQAVYQVVEKKLDVKMLRAKYRVQIVREGLRDRVPSVQRAAVALCKQWLHNRPGLAKSSATALVELVALLDVDGGEQHVEAAELLVEHLLEAQTVSVEAADVPALEADASSSAVLVWRKQAQRVQATQQWGQLDAILPDVPRFSQMLASAVTEDRTGAVTQLLQLASLLDVADEQARRLLSSALRNLLPTLRDANVQVPLVLAALRVLHPDVDDCNRIVFEALSEVMQPIDFSEQKLTEEVLAEQDAHLEALEERIAALERQGNKKGVQEELAKCVQEHDAIEAQQLEHGEAMNMAWLRALRVAEEHLRHTPLDLRDASIAELRQRLVRRVLRWGGANALVRQAALRVLGLYALRDVAVARDQLPLLLHALGNEEELVQEAVLRAVFDFIARFGTALFATKSAEEQGEKEEEEEEEASPMQTQLMEALYAQLDADDVVLRSIVVEGFTKLLYTRQLSDQRVLGVLLLMYLNPATQGEDARLQQLLASFLPAYAYSHGQNQRLVAAVLPRVLRAWHSAQSAKSALASVPASQVLKFLLALTDPRQMRAYWSERPHLLKVLELPVALHHELAARLIDDLLLAPAHRGSAASAAVADSPFALPLLRELRSMAFDATSEENAASLRTLIDSALPKAIALCKSHPKLKGAAEDLESSVPSLQALLEAHTMEPEQEPSSPLLQHARAISSAALESPAGRGQLHGRDASPQLDEALTRTARKDRAPIDRRGGIIMPTLQLDAAVEEEVEEEEEEEEGLEAQDKETAAEGASTQAEGSVPELTEHLSTATTTTTTTASRKRAHAEDAPATRTKKARKTAATTEGENEPPQKKSAASTSAPTPLPEEKKRGGRGQAQAQGGGGGTKTRKGRGVGAHE